MKRKIIFSALSILFFVRSNAQSEDVKIAGVATAAAIVLLDQEIHKIEEQIEILGTEYILANHPDVKEFNLSSLSIAGQPLNDPNNGRFYAYAVEWGAIQNTPEENFLLFAFINPDRESSNSLKFVEVHLEEWLTIYKNYLEQVSGLQISDNGYIHYYEWQKEEEKEISVMNEFNAIVYPLYFEPKMDSVEFYRIQIYEENAVVINDGKKDKVFPKRRLHGDSYVVSASHPDFSVVYNERKMGFFCYEYQSYVQIKKSLLKWIHRFMIQGAYDEGTLNPTTR